MGVLAAGAWLQQLLYRARPAVAAVTARPALALAVPLALGSLVTGATAVQSVPRNVHTVGLQFNTSGDETLVSSAKLQFLQTVGRLVPPSALVADNPFDGTAYLFALTGTHVLFPQLSQSIYQDPTYLAGNLVQLSHNPRACDLVRQYGVQYMVVAPDDFITEQALHGTSAVQVRAELAYYAGVAYPVPHSGFKLMASAADGRLRLYKILICQRPNPSAAPIGAAKRG
jgi:hypothetical protein